MKDKIKCIALKLINQEKDFLETRELLDKARKIDKQITRTKLFSRLNILRGEGEIKGKFVGGKVWIWWKKDSDRFIKG